MGLYTENSNSDTLPGVFELWSIGPERDTADLSYGLDAVEPEGAPVWRLALPVDRDEAADRLAGLEAFLSSSEEALESIPGRLDRLVETSQSTGGGGISFDQESMPGLPAPEADLLASLQVLSQPFGGVSFDVVGEGLELRLGKLMEAYQGFEAGMERLLRQITHFAWVETEVGEKLIARTIVSWNGDANTAWWSGLGVDLYQSHRRSLGQALSSRNLVLHALVITAQSAAKLGVLLAAPGGGLLVLPFAWKFVSQVLAEVEKIQELQKTPRL